MSMFKHPSDEEKPCQALKALVEEWGPENVIVLVPKHWKDYGSSALGRVRMQFLTEAAVSIVVQLGEAEMCRYDCDLQHI